MPCRAEPADAPWKSRFGAWPIPRRDRGGAAKAMAAGPGGLSAVFADQFRNQISGWQARRATPWPARSRLSPVVWADGHRGAGYFRPGRAAETAQHLQARPGSASFSFHPQPRIARPRTARSTVMYLRRDLESGAAGASSAGRRSLHPRACSRRPGVSDPKLIIRDVPSVREAGGCEFHPRVPLATDLWRCRAPAGARDRPSTMATCHFVPSRPASARTPRYHPSRERTTSNDTTTRLTRRRRSSAWSGV